MISIHNFVINSDYQCLTILSDHHGQLVEVFRGNLLLYDEVESFLALSTEQTNAHSVSHILKLVSKWFCGFHFSPLLLLLLSNFYYFLPSLLSSILFSFHCFFSSLLLSSPFSVFFSFLLLSFHFLFFSLIISSFFLSVCHLHLSLSSPFFPFPLLFCFLSSPVLLVGLNTTNINHMRLQMA